VKLEMSAVQKAEMFAGMSTHSWALVGWYVVAFLVCTIALALLWHYTSPDDQRRP
jgi:disulfide bond formation protein DsbB